MDTQSKHSDPANKPSREARLSAILYAIRGHITDSGLSDAECVAKIELELMDFNAAERQSK